MDKWRYIIHTALAISFAMLLILLSGCYAGSMSKYYSKRENYITATGIIEYVFNDEKEKILYIEFSDLEPAFDDTCFKIAGDNYDIALENGIIEILKIGKQAAFASAPQCFGDGYIIPIAAITVDGKVILSFEDGFNNFKKLYN